MTRNTTPPTLEHRIARFSSMSKVSAAQIKETPIEAVHDNKAADVDQVLKDIADYVQDYKIESPLAVCLYHLGEEGMEERTNIANQ